MRMIAATFVSATGVFGSTASSWAANTHNHNHGNSWAAIPQAQWVDLPTAVPADHTHESWAPEPAPQAGWAPEPETPAPEPQWGYVHPEPPAQWAPPQWVPSCGNVAYGQCRGEGTVHDCCPDNYVCKKVPKKDREFAVADGWSHIHEAAGKYSQCVPEPDDECEEDDDCGRKEYCSKKGKCMKQKKNGKKCKRDEHCRNYCLYDSLEDKLNGRGKCGFSVIRRV